MNKASIEKILKTMSVLYIESDRLFANNVTEALKLKCKQVHLVHTINDAKIVYDSYGIDIIICDLLLSDGYVFDFVKKIREYNNIKPIVIISHILETDKLLQCIPLNLTAYIKKPIPLAQLRESLITCATRILKSGSYELSFEQNIRYNVHKKALHKDGVEIKMTSNEISLLNLLILNQHYVLSKDEIKELIWPDDFSITDEAFKSLLSRLRTKIGKNSIKTVAGTGYILSLCNE